MIADYPRARCSLCGSPIRVGDRIRSVSSVWERTKGDRPTAVKGKRWDATRDWVHEKCPKPLRAEIEEARKRRKG